MFGLVFFLKEVEGATKCKNFQTSADKESLGYKTSPPPPTCGSLMRVLDLMTKYKT